MPAGGSIVIFGGPVKHFQLETYMVQTFSNQRE